ncbi:MAG TPA: DUF1540 domain-containing protein [Longimicrobiales bacterium]|nr:DUF1540 domain-containing protein [Longimicrobiales bacterium]
MRQPTPAISRVASCSATDCSHNRDQQCHAGEIEVRMSPNGAICGTYDPQKPQPRP